MTDGQSAGLSWNKSPIWGLRPDFYYCQTIAGLLMWGALSDERMGLSFTIAPVLCQCSHFQVRVPWDSWIYFTVSDSRLPFSLPPTTRRVRWRYSTEWMNEWMIWSIESLNMSFLYNFGTNQIEITISNSSYYCVLIRCCGNMSSDPLPSNRCPSTVDTIISGTCLLNHCLAVDICITISCSWSLKVDIFLHLMQTLKKHAASSPLPPYDAA
jgi:hypothetical protein